MLVRSLLIGALVSLASCAPTAFRGYVGASAVRFNGQVALGQSTGAVPLQTIENDLEDALDVGDTDYFPYLRAEVEWKDHRLTVSGFAYDQDGEGTLAADWGDIGAGTAVATQMDFFNVKTAWSYDLLDVEVLRLAPGLALNTFGYDIAVREFSTTDFEQLETLVFVPMVFLQGEADLGLVAGTLDVGLMDADLGDADGLYWDIEALLRVTPGPGIELFAGYRLSTVDAEGEADGREFEADMQLSGFIFGAGVVF